jgi:hypothetical protein
MDDPWLHRSQGMRCRTCMFFVAKATPEPVGDRGDLGRCRRHAPTMSGFPAVFEADWCGDHKLDEQKAYSQASLRPVMDERSREMKRAFEALEPTKAVGGADRFPSYRT